MANKKLKGTSDTDVQSTIKRANAFLDLVDRVRSLGWKGIFDGLLKIMFIVCFVLFIKFLINPKPTLEYYLELSSNIESEQHEELIDKRMKSTPLINNGLQLMRADMEMERTFVIEFHNGNNNLAALPFWWGDMTYESLDDNCYSIRDTWTNISLTRYNFFTSVCTDAEWCGDVKDVASVDDGFAKKIEADGITYLAMVLLYNTDGKPMGILGAGCSCENPSFDKSNIIKHLVKYSQVINPLLIGK